MNTTSKKRIVACPECGNDTEYSLDNEFRPFCSKRCSLVDLGEWASEGYSIPVQTNPNNIDPDDLS